ncbi:helix-turn-helix transcriptional regulator [Blastococcus sp. SYSU D00695]
MSGPREPRRIRAWSEAYVNCGIADAVWIPDELTEFRGRIRRRTLEDLVLVDVEADPFGTRWTRSSATSDHVGVSVNTRRYTERVVFGDRRETVSTSSVVVWDPAVLVEAEVLSPMAQTVLLVPKSALHLTRSGSVHLPEALGEDDKAVLRLLRSVVLAVARDADRFGPAAAAVARTTVVELLCSLVEGRRQSSGAAVSEGMRMAVCRWVDENLHLGPLTPVQAADEHGISLRSLHRLFADRGESFASLVRRRRLEGALRDLLRTDDMVQTIAVRWGYADASQFITEFKRVHGTPPATYRRASRAAV